MDKYDRSFKKFPLPISPQLITEIVSALTGSEEFLGVNSITTSVPSKPTSISSLGSAWIDATWKIRVSLCCTKYQMHTSFFK